MKILVVGAGSIGKRHIRNLNLLGYTNIDVVDINTAQLEYVKQNFKIKNTFNNLEDALSREEYDVAFILTPPVFHVPLALKLAREGIDLFIEKPLSHNMDHIGELIKIKEKNKLIIMVGYNQRFNFGIQKLKSYITEGKLGKIYYIRAEFGQYLPDWRPWMDYRKGYTATRELGGGILLDGSHEIDYVLWLAGSKVTNIKAIYTKVSTLEINVEDMAEIILEFENGIIGSVHVNMIERKYNRYCKVVGEMGYAKWIFKDNIFEFYDSNFNRSTVEKYETDYLSKSYISELEHFFYCVQNRYEPLSNIYTARDTLEIIMKIRRDHNCYRL